MKGRLQVLKQLLFSFEYDNIPIEKKELIRAVLRYDLDQLYLGERIDYYSDGSMTICDFQGTRLIPEQKTGEWTLFQHTKEGYYYYDILDKNTQCEELNEGLNFAQHVCTKLESVNSLLDKPKVNRKIK